MDFTMQVMNEAFAAVRFWEACKGKRCVMCANGHVPKSLS